MSDVKTSTFTIHHDRCKPEHWTAKDVLLLASFLRSGSLQNAASLSRLGVQLVMSEHHVPKGGTLEEVGFCTSKDEVLACEIDEIIEDDITEVYRVYRGPAEWVVRVGIGGADGYVEDWEYDFKPTAEAAAAYFDELTITADPTP